MPCKHNHDNDKNKNNDADKDKTMTLSHLRDDQSKTFHEGHGGDDHGQLWQPVSMALHGVEVVGVVVWVLRHSIDLQVGVG